MSVSEVVKERRDPTLTEIFRSRTVTIKVGRSKREYQVHEAVLTHHSEYFRAACEPGNFKGCATGEILLEDIRTVAFEAFIDWLYSKDLPEIKKGDWTKYGGDNHNACAHITHLNILAYRLIVPELKRVVLEAAVTTFNMNGPRIFKAISFAFNDLPADHPFLQLLVDHHCLFYTPEDNDLFQESIRKLPQEFIFRIIRKYSEVAKKDDELKLTDSCKD